MSDFNLIADFYIDDGELEGLTPQQIFLLGWELRKFYDMVEDGRAFSMSVREANAERCARLARQRGREAVDTTLGADGVPLEIEGWRRISVGSNIEVHNA